MNQLVVSGVGAVNGTERCFTNMCHAREREHHSRRCKACPICATLDDFPACVAASSRHHGWIPAFAGMTNVGLVGRDTVVASPRRLSLIGVGKAFAPPLPPNRTGG